MNKIEIVFLLNAISIILLSMANLIRNNKNKNI